MDYLNNSQYNEEDSQFESESAYRPNAKQNKPFSSFFQKDFQNQYQINDQSNNPSPSTNCTEAPYLESIDIGSQIQEDHMIQLESLELFREDKKSNNIESYSQSISVESLQQISKSDHAFQNILALQQNMHCQLMDNIRNSNNIHYNTNKSDDEKNSQNAGKILKRKKQTGDINSQQKFRNMKKLVLNGILKQFTKEQFQANRIPCQFYDELIDISHKMKESGKSSPNTSTANKKMDLFSQPHFNALFLKLNEESAEFMVKKNQKNIDLHQLLYGIDLKQYHNLSNETISEVNMLKQSMFKVAGNFLTSQLDEDIPVVISEYYRIVLESIKKMLEGSCINKFLSYKQIKEEKY